ncbi:MAG: hypothetical protein KDA65_19725 [Planctomycetaceae bacterium]|nr:hypothetical protein [Planctomycetaceae bacterium]
MSNKSRLIFIKVFCVLLLLFGGPIIWSAEIGALVVAYFASFVVSFLAALLAPNQRLEYGILANFCWNISFIVMLFLQTDLSWSWLMILSFSIIAVSFSASILTWMLARLIVLYMDSLVRK